MKRKHNEKRLSCILCIVLIVAMALSATGCNGKNAENAPAEPQTETAFQAEGNVLGEGEKQFMFTVTDKDGTEKQYEIHTDKKTVGEALLALGLIEGEDGDYGLYVKTVCGVTLDYDSDGSYWAFYVNDDYAQTGVDSTPITEGEHYSFIAE